MSLGGAFLSTDTPLPPSSESTLSLTIPGGRSAQLGARVVHVLTAERARCFGSTAGMGVQFERLDAAGTAFVSELVDWAVARGPSPRVVRVRTGADLSAVQHEPMLSFLVGYVDGRRDLEALAQELALEVDTIERMLGQLITQGVIEIVGAQPRASAAPPASTRPARTSIAAARSSRAPRAVLAEATAAAEAARVAAASSAHLSQPPAASAGPSVKPAPPSAAAQRPSVRPSASGRAASIQPPPGSRAPSVRPSRNPPASQLDSSQGAAAQILAQAEAAYGAGQAMEASRHLKLLAAMTFDDPRTQQRASELRQQVMRAAAVDFEKQALHEEGRKQWGKAASLWMKVAEGRPQDAAPLQRAALAQLEAGEPLRLAMEAAKRAVQLAPNEAQAHRTLAKVYVAADMQASANRELEVARGCDAEPSQDAPTTGILRRLLGRDD